MRRTSYASHSESSSINVTPLIDVMLVLMVVFLIAAPVLARRVDVDLPQGDSRSVPPPKVELVVRSDGAVQWDGVLLPRDAVAEQLRLTALRDPQPALVVGAEPGVSYETVAVVLAQVRQTGIRAMSYAEAR